MESARSAFHAQLATVMDSLLAAAVCEIAKIFEGSLREQQEELVQKSEEISVLRGRLEKAEKKHRAKVGAGDQGEVSSGDREGRGKQHRQTPSGQNVEKDMPSQSLSGKGLRALKEEVTGQDGSSHVGSRPNLESIPPTAGNLPGGLRHGDAQSSTQAKARLSHWEQGSHSVDNRHLQGQGPTSFLSIAQSGRCSPRPDPNLVQPGEWIPRLEATQRRVPGLVNLQADGTSCSAPANKSSNTEASCFQPGFGSDENANEEDEVSFPFLEQETENQNSDENSVQGQGLGERQPRQVEAQASSGETQWRPRDDRGGKVLVSNIQRVASFGGRDTLRPQSTLQSLSLRHANNLGHLAASGGGSGRPYSCPYCTKCFTYPSHQRRHLLRHTGVRLHPCQFCDKSFLTPSELTVHTRTHTGERPFGCTQCGKRFARSGNLRAHQRDVHMGKRPFACNECGKRFAHRGNLRVHNHRVHQGDPYYIDDQQEPDGAPNAI